MSKMKLLQCKRFIVGNTKFNILTNQGYNIVYEVLRNYAKLDEFYSWKEQSRLKC